MLGLAAALAAPLGNAALAADGAKPYIEILRPAKGMPIYDRVSVAFRLHGVSDQAVRSARVLLDGTSLAEIDHPPWITTIDAGFALTPRELTLEVRLAGGGRLVATRSAPALEIGEQLDVRLVNLSVSVTDESGRPVRGLQRSDFEIEDAGEKVRIERWNEQPEALSVSLVMDASVSMRGKRFELARRAARAFIGMLEERDRLGLVVFNDKLLREIPVGEAGQTIGKTLDDIVPSGGTALYDAMYRAVDQLEAGPAGMRRVMVVVSDGRDAARVGWKQASAHSLEETLRHAHAQNVVIYTLGLGTNLAFESSIEGDFTTEGVLESFASSTGGRLELLAFADDLEPAFRQVIEELRHHYSMAFTPASSSPRRRRGEPEGWRPISVELPRLGDAVVRTREGYFSR